MAQTVNGKKEEKTRQQQRLHRPGQRQQERLERQARRRRRQRYWTSGIAAVAIIALSTFGFVQYQRYSAAQAASQQATATAIAERNAAATATALAQNCFTSSTGQAIPAIYAGPATPTAGPTNSPAITGTPVTLAGGLKYVDIKVGKGTAAKKNSKISVEYTGWLASTCQKFDSSYDRSGQAFPLTLGQGQVIKGWDEGLVGVKAGGIRRLYIPAALAYGAQGQQTSQGQVIIPPNAILIFDVIVLSVK